MKNCVISSLMTFFFLGYAMFENQSELPKSEQVVNEILNHSIHIFEKKYKMNAIATNVAMPRGIVKLLGLDFQIQGPLSKDEIRRILINVSQEFLLLINTDEKLKNYLQNHSFEIENIDITLFIIDSNGKGLDAPNIGIAGIKKSKLDYWTLVRNNNIPKIEEESIETYNEALLFLQNHK